MNLENISNLRNRFLENKVWKVWQTFWDFLIWDRNRFFVNEVWWFGKFTGKPAKTILLV